MADNMPTIQSFNPKDNISPEKAHEIGKRFIEKNDKFKGQNEQHIKLKIISITLLQLLTL